MWLAEMLDELDLPDAVVSMWWGQTGGALVRHRGVDKIAFTGSSATGRHIAAACGEQLNRVSLELGGKSCGDYPTTPTSTTPSDISRWPG